MKTKFTTLFIFAALSWHVGSTPAQASAPSFCGSRIRAMIDYFKARRLPEVWTQADSEHLNDEVDAFLKFAPLLRSDIRDQNLLVWRSFLRELGQTTFVDDNATETPHSSPLSRELSKVLVDGWRKLGWINRYGAFEFGQTPQKILKTFNELAPSNLRAESVMPDGLEPFVHYRENSYVRFRNALSSGVVLVKSVEDYLFVLPLMTEPKFAELYHLFADYELLRGEQMFYGSLLKPFLFQADGNVSKQMHGPGVLIAEKLRAPAPLEKEKDVLARFASNPPGYRIMPSDERDILHLGSVGKLPLSPDRPEDVLYALHVMENSLLYINGGLRQRYKVYDTEIARKQEDLKKLLLRIHRARSAWKVEN